MRRTKLYLITAFIGLFLLNSCDYWSYYDFNIENSTESDLVVEFKVQKFYNGQFPEVRYDTIKPSEKKCICTLDGGNCGQGWEPSRLPELHYFEEFNIYNTDSVKANVDFIDESKWAFESRVYLGIYTFTVMKEDFKY